MSRRRANMLRGVLAIITATAALAILLALMGFPPLTIARAAVDAAFGTSGRFVATLLVACPLLLTGLAVCVAFRCGVWNIGAEGQYLVGALAATTLGIHLSELPAWLAWPTVLLCAMLAGAMWAGLAAWLKLARGVQEVLTTILLNFVAVHLVAICVRGPLTDTVSTARETSADIAQTARLPLVAAAFGLHAGVILALVAAIAIAFFLAGTVPGLRIRIVGANPIAARFAGLPAGRYAAASFLISGALAGLAGGVELAGNSFHLTTSFGAGYGYTAIAVALLARLSPMGCVASALFFAAVTTGVRGLQYADLPGVASVPTSLTFVAQGVVVLAVAWLAGPPRGAAAS